MSQSKTQPSWLEAETNRANELKVTGETTNNTAPKLERVLRAPTRKQKAFYIQDQHSDAFEELVFAQKKLKGKKAPELAEEAIELLLKKYKVKL